MRTNIVIDDALMKQAMQASGARSKREAVELGLRTLVKLQQQREIRLSEGVWLGKVIWMPNGWMRSLQPSSRDRC